MGIQDGMSRASESAVENGLLPQDLNIPERQLVFERQRLREMRHRIKNDLQKLTSILTLQSRETHHLECVACIGRVNSIAQLHALLNELPNDLTSDTICMAAYLQSVTDGARAAFGNHLTIDVSFDSNLQLDARRAALVGLILNEAIMNALKHAFPEGGTAANRRCVPTGQSGYATLMVASSNSRIFRARFCCV